MKFRLATLPPHSPATAAPTSLSNKLWATGLAGVSLFFATCALFGYFPGESIGVRMFAQLADRFGAVETGVGTIVVGLVLTTWILMPRPGVATDGGFDRDGGGDGGD